MATKKDKVSKRESYEVYVGKVESEQLICWMIEKLNLPNDEKIEPSNALACLYAVKLDSNGVYLPGSFAVSTFIWAICRLVNYGYNSDLNVDELTKFQSEINQSFFDEDQGEWIFVDKAVLDKLYEMICQKIGLESHQIKPAKWVKVKTQYGRKKAKNNDNDYEFPALDCSTELISSFYINDIKKVACQPTKRVMDYVHAMDCSTTKVDRIQIDTDVKQMQQWLNATKYPLGIWPSKYSPCLMQQIGINLAISDE